MDNPRFIVTAEECRGIEATLRHTVENLHNPYQDFFHWCKNELYDIRSFKEAMMQKDMLEDQRNRLV